jgi:hypothetical protein
LERKEPVVTAPRENKEGVFDALCCNGLSRVDGLCAVVGFIREASQQKKGQPHTLDGLPFLPGTLWFFEIMLFADQQS